MGLFSVSLKTKTQEAGTKATVKDKSNYDPLIFQFNYFFQMIKGIYVFS